MDRGQEISCGLSRSIADGDMRGPMHLPVGVVRLESEVDELGIICLSSSLSFLTWGEERRQPTEWSEWTMMVVVNCRLEVRMYLLSFVASCAATGRRCRKRDATDRGPVPNRLSFGSNVGDGNLRRFGRFLGAGGS